MPITLPGKDGEWEQVDNDVVKLGCTLGYKKNNGSATEAQLLDAIAECVGGEVCYVQYVVYKKIKAPEWQKREKGRMKDRKLPIWSKEEFWEENTTIHALHFVHVSEKDDKLLAYTQSPEKGERDIQTPIKPGRYLRQYFGEVLSEKRIAFLAAWQANGVRPEDVGAQDVLRFATTPDQIAKVYIDGPVSCMSGRHFLDIKTHPARVYGAGDLAIVYLEKENEKTGKSKPIARALVWPEKKVAGRVYPSSENWPQDGFISAAESEKTKNILSSLLKEEGYKFVGEGGSFEGARLLKVDHPCYNHMWLLPYLDNNLRITKGNK